MSPSSHPGIRERTFQFSCTLVNFCREIETFSSVKSHVVIQLVKSGTSIGANVEEAKAAYSRREFAVKNAIALKEAREALYWLRIMHACKLAKTTDQIDALIDEAHQLVAILTSIVKTARSRLNNQAAG
ncbi:MAG TPA: four helix bundle protein [Vicinamibacterales bacterium]|jgi:four helix bundle protein